MRIDVWFVMLPGVLSLDMTGPAETVFEGEIEL